MDAFDAIITRRSIRSYTDTDISDELMQKLLQAALAAPSANNEQPWHFIVIRDRATLDYIPQIHPHSKMLLQAPAALAVCADLNLEKNPGCGHWIQDCAAATQNILIAAHALGLGACWIGIDPKAQHKEAIKTRLKLPDNIEPFCIIALGHPNETKKTSRPQKPDRIHQNQW